MTKLRQISDEVRLLVVEVLLISPRVKATYEYIKSVYKVSERSARRIWRRYEEEKTHKADRKRRKKGWNVLPEDQFLFLKEVLAKNASLFYSEMVIEVYQEFGSLYTKDQIRRCLKANGITRKVLQRHALEQDPILRAAFRHLMRPAHRGGHFTASQILAVDEVHANKKKIRRMRGYANRGTPAFKRVYNSQGNGGGCSVVSSFSICGTQSVSMFNHGIKAQNFLHALEHDILPITNPYPGINSVILLDNASNHERNGIRNLCDDWGVVVVFLPPYSYDFNPIELSFHLAKDYIRSKWGEAEHNEDVKERMREALLSIRDGEICCNLFERCAINVTPAERQWARS